MLSQFLRNGVGIVTGIVVMMDDQAQWRRDMSMAMHDLVPVLRLVLGQEELQVEAAVGTVDGFPDGMLLSDIESPPQALH